MIGMAHFCKGSSDSVCAAVKLIAILDWRTPEQAVQSCYRNRASRLLQRRLALVASCLKLFAFGTGRFAAGKSTVYSYQTCRKTHKL